MFGCTSLISGSREREETKNVGYCSERGVHGQQCGQSTISSFLISLTRERHASHTGECGHIQMYITVQFDLNYSDTSTNVHMSVTISIWLARLVIYIQSIVILCQAKKRKTEKTSRCL